MTPVLLLLGQVLHWPTLHSAHLSWMNINSVYEIPGPILCRSLITFFDPVFPYIVIESETCDRLGWTLGARDWIFWQISFTFTALLSESFTKPSSPGNKLGLTIHETRLNNLWFKRSSTSIRFCDVGGQGWFGTSHFISSEIDRDIDTRAACDLLYLRLYWLHGQNLVKQTYLMTICTPLPHQRSLKVCKTGFYQEAVLGGGSLCQWHSVGMISNFTV